MSYYSGDICNMSYYGVDDYNAAVSWYVRRRRGMDDGLLTYNITGLEAIRAYVRAYVISYVHQLLLLCLDGWVDT